MKTIGDSFGSVLGAHASGNNKALVALAKKLIYQICGSKCKVVRGIADWELGAGAGVFASIPKTLSPEVTKQVSAKLGLATNAHSVLSFTSGSGKEKLHVFLTNETNSTTIREALPRVKIKSLYFIPHVKGSILILHDPKAILDKNVQALVKMFKGKHIVITGKGEYLGSDASDPETAKKKANQAFRKALGIQETTDPDSSPNDSDSGKGEKSGGSRVQGASRSSSKGSTGKDGIARRPGTFKPK